MEKEKTLNGDNLLYLKKCFLLLGLFIFNGQAQVIDLSHQLGPAYDQGDSPFCQSYVASDILSQYFRTELSEQRISSLSIALQSNIFNEKVYKRFLSKFKSNSIELRSVESYSLKQDEESTELKDRGNFVGWTLFSALNTSKVCLEKDFSYSDNQNNILLADFKERKLEYSSLHRIWGELSMMKLRDEKFLTCQNKVELPKVEHETVIVRSIGYKKSIELVIRELSNNRLLGISYRWGNLGKHKTSFSEGHASSIVGVKKEGRKTFLALRNHFGERCLFKSNSFEHCFNGVEWVEASSLLRNSMSIVYLKTQLTK